MLVSSFIRYGSRISGYRKAMNLELRDTLCQCIQLSRHCQVGVTPHNRQRIAGATAGRGFGRSQLHQVGFSPLPRATHGPQSCARLKVGLCSIRKRSSSGLGSSVFNFIEALNVIALRLGWRAVLDRFLSRYYPSCALDIFPRSESEKHASAKSCHSPALQNL